MKLDFWIGYISLLIALAAQGESVQQTAVREAKEEIGVDLLERDIKVLSFLQRFNGKREYFDIFCEVSKWTGTISNMEPKKCRYWARFI